MTGAVKPSTVSGDDRNDRDDRDDRNDRDTDRARVLDEHNQVVASGGHLLQQLDMRDVDAAGADLAVELTLDGRVSNPRGALQGGIIATLVDIVAGRAVLAGEPGNAVATSDLSVHYLRGVTAGPARAVATVVRRGNRSAVVTVDIFDAGANAGTGTLCAVATASFSITPAPDDQVS